MAEIPSSLDSALAFYNYLGVGAGEQAFLKKHVAFRYRTVAIAKRRGGQRILLVPERRLKFLQRRVLPLLEALYVVRAPVHGFVKGRGAISNASAHQARPFLLNIDLREFFPSITWRRALGMLQAIGLKEEVASAICQICVVKNQLPQGAPTSPILANMICFRLDKDLMKFAAAHRLKYTRYADDISFSSYVKPLALFDGDLPSAGKLTPERLSTALSALIGANGFTVNADKIWFSDRKARKEVTGLIVNEFTNVKRSFVRDLRASLYKVETIGKEQAANDFHQRYGGDAALANVIRGRLEWISQVRGRSFGAYRTLAKRYNILYPESQIHIEPTYDEILEKAVWILECDNGQDCSQATAFFLDGVGLVTANHVIESLPEGTSAEIYRPANATTKYKATPTAKRCGTRDLVIMDHDIPVGSYLYLEKSSAPVSTKDSIIAIGYPDYAHGDTLCQKSGNITSKLTKSAVKLLEVSAVMGDGLSGGPIVNDRYQVVAVVKSGGLGEQKQIGVDIAELLDLASE